MREEYRRLMKQYGGFIPFDEISKLKRSKQKRSKVKRKDKKFGSKQTRKKSYKCDNSQIIVEKETGKRRCSTNTEPGIVIRGEDDSLYILKKFKSIKKWVKI